MIKKYILTAAVAASLPFFALAVDEPQAGAGTPPPPPPQGSGGQTPPSPPQQQFQQQHQQQYEQQYKQEYDRQYKQQSDKQHQEQFEKMAPPPGGQPGMGTDQGGPQGQPPSGAEQRRDDQRRGEPDQQGLGARSFNPFSGSSTDQSGRSEQRSEQRPQKQERSSQSFQQHGEDQNGGREEYVDPRELKDALRQIKDLKSQISQLSRSAAKQNLSAEVATLSELASKVGSFEQTLKSAKNGSEARETLQDYYDSQLWDGLDQLRVKIQLPKEVAQFAKEMTRLDKFLATKNLTIEGVNLDGIRSRASELRSTIKEVQDNLAAGNGEAAQNTMQDIYSSGVHPGEVYGVLMQLREITRHLKTVKNADVRATLKEVLDPIYQSLGEGDYREANMALNAVNRELMEVMSRLQSARSIDQSIQQKLRQLEQRLEQAGNDENKTSYVPYYEYQRASIIEVIRDWFGW